MRINRFIKAYLTFYVTLFVGTILIVANSCSNTKTIPIKCLSDYISENIEEEKVKDFIRLEGLAIWREGWSNLTSEIVEEDHLVFDECGLKEYLSHFNLNIEEKKGRMIMVYSIHSYLKNGKVNLKSIRQKVDSLYFLEYESPRKE